MACCSTDLDNHGRGVEPVPRWRPTGTDAVAARPPRPPEGACVPAGGAASCGSMSESNSTRAPISTEMIEGRLDRPVTAEGGRLKARPTRRNRRPPSAAGAPLFSGSDAWRRLAAWATKRLPAGGEGERPQEDVGSATMRNIFCGLQKPEALAGRPILALARIDGWFDGRRSVASPVGEELRCPCLAARSGVEIGTSAGDAPLFIRTVTAGAGPRSFVEQTRSEASTGRRRRRRRHKAYFAASE